MTLHPAITVLPVPVPGVWTGPQAAVPRVGRPADVPSAGPMVRPGPVRRRHGAPPATSCWLGNLRGVLLLAVAALLSERVVAADSRAATLLAHPGHSLWVLLAVALVAALGAGLYVRHRLMREANRRLRETREVDLRHLAQDLHDDVGADLTAIAYRTHAASQQADGWVRRELEACSQGSLELVSRLREMVWCLNPENDSGGELAGYLSHQLRQFAPSEGGRLRIEVDPSVEMAHIGGEIRRHLVPAVKEAVNNAFKHSRASEISVDVRLQPPLLVVAVRDNGVGLPTAMWREKVHSFTGGQGLRNLESRLREIGGTVSRWPREEGGTEIRFEVPLHGAHSTDWKEVAA